MIKTTRIAILWDRKILIGVKPDGSKGLPGGIPREDESELAAVLAATVRETGIVCNPQDVKSAGTVTKDEFEDGKPVRKKIFLFVVHLQKKVAPVNTPDMRNHAWYAFDDIPYREMSKYVPLALRALMLKYKDTPQTLHLEFSEKDELTSSQFTPAKSALA